MPVGAGRPVRQARPLILLDDLRGDIGDEPFEFLNSGRLHRTNIIRLAFVIAELARD
jgi:hypothetical protein